MTAPIASSAISFLPAPADGGQLQPGTSDQPCTVYIGTGRRYELTTLDEPGRAKVSIQLDGAQNPYVDTLNLHSAQFRERLAERLAGDRRPDLQYLFEQDLQQLATVLPEPAKNGKVHEPESGHGAIFLPVTPCATSVDGSAVLRDVLTIVQTHLVVPEGASDFLPLWLLHTYAADAANIFPILTVTSKRSESGKSTVLFIVRALAHRAWNAVSLTGPTLYRVIESEHPTVLIDEADTFLKERDELRGILNAGHTRGTRVPRCVGENFEVRWFDVHGPKAIAFIGKQHPTIMGRSIEVKMRPALPHETFTPWSLNLEQSEAFAVLRGRLARWAADHVNELKQATPDVPVELRPLHRATDNWRPLFAIADAIGGEWPERARRAALLLSVGTAERRRDDALHLMEALRPLSANWPEFVPSADLLTSVQRQIPSLTARKLGTLLAEFEIEGTRVRAEDGTQPRGYDREDLLRALKECGTGEP